MKRIITPIILGLMLTVVGCSTENDEILPDDQEMVSGYEDDANARRGRFNNLPDSIIINSPGLYPEGLTFHPWKKTFYVSSIKKGVISKVDFQGNVTAVTKEGDLVSTAGMKFVPFRQQVIACNGDAGVSIYSSPSTIGQLAEVAKVRTGRRSSMGLDQLTGLYPGPQFINDLTYDWYGNVYVTDSFSPVIYKIDKNGKESVFAEHPSFAGAPGAFGLNGIVWHPDGFLIVSKHDEAKLLKVSIEDPSQVEEISIPTKIASPDGLLLANRNTLIFSGNALAPTDAKIGVYKLKTTDQWNSAEVVDIMETPNNFPTTLTRVYNEIYVLYGEIDKLLMGAPDVEEYIIKKVSFDN